MGNKAQETFIEMSNDNKKNNVKGIIMEDHCECSSDSSISIGSISEDTMDSLCSSYSSDELTEDASSSSFSSSSSSSHSKDGPLYELSELMNHLPIKRGLSMFYEGKAQSFTSLGRVQSIEDLPKKGITTTTTYSKRMKSCKSYGGGLDNHNNNNRISFTPKPTISKKTSPSTRGSFLSLQSKKGSFLGGSRPSISVHKNF
ncbi:protein OXIDATIVE STRESS 3-like [Arachis stenosperma]|uniref:protein OXIDATIVE STRESS 3-like n=1 Tax=Arachis stenosperma TaxID=217475 RepID=UPI0025ABCCF4|nr:protein OXIDATIVE STRESS 3-like [Arachis stenosperma]